MLRFLHTADWHLGMPARFLAPEAAARFGAARLEAVQRLGEVARERGCAFLLVCGDAFDSNLVGRRVVHQATQALADLRLPTFLLPGNHDPLDPVTVYRREEFVRSLPGNVRVLSEVGPVEAAPGVELIAAPWWSKRPTQDPLAAASTGLGPAPAGVRRILVGHGAVDALLPEGATVPGAIRLAPLRAALAQRHFDYVALGDRHSATPLEPGRAIWYSGTPEATDFDAPGAGQGLVVELDGGPPRVEPVRVGRWRLLRHDLDVSGEDGPEQLAGWLEALPGKGETVVRLALRGTLGLEAHGRLEAVLERAADLLAGLDRPEGEQRLAVLPADFDFDRLGLGGFALAAVDRLRAQAQGDGPPAEAARDALALVFRLGGGEGA